jgi:hypothetical protein
VGSSANTGAILPEKNMKYSDRYIAREIAKLEAHRESMKRSLASAEDEAIKKHYKKNIKSISLVIDSLKLWPKR